VCCLSLEGVDRDSHDRFKLGILRYFRHPSEFQPLLLSELIISFYLSGISLSKVKGFTICISVANGSPS
jgi:hypothetical protein